MMVVVPTSNDVRLHHDMAGRDYASYAATAFAILALVVLRRRTVRAAR
jgi:hypothetical protein